MFSLCSWNAVGKTWPAAREHEPSEPIWCSFSVLAWPTFVTMSFGVLYLAHQAFGVCRIQKSEQLEIT